MTRYGTRYLPGAAACQDPAIIADDGNCGIEGGTASRIAWFRLDWPCP